MISPTRLSVNDFKDIFSEYLSNLALAIKLGERFQKTPYMVTREFAVNFTLDPGMANFLFEALQDKEIYHFLLNY